MTVVGSHDGENLRSRVVSGVTWKAFSQVAVQGLGFATTLTLVRLLSRGDIGVANMALIFASLAFLLADVGLSTALIQRRTITDDDCSTVFWSNAALGLILTAAGIALAPTISDIYGRGEVAPLFAALSFTFLFTALGATQGALLIRNMQFRSLELRTIVGTSVATAVAIVVAVLGFGPWAIIAQALTNSGVSTLLLWRSSSWRPRLVYSVASLRSLLGFGSFIFAGGLVSYVERNADSFLVGRVLGSSALGAYSVVYNVMLVPMTKLANPLKDVFLPALSASRDSGNVGSIWLRLTSVVGLICLPAMLGLLVVAPDFVTVVLTRKYESAIPVLRVLTLVGILQPLAAQTTTLLQSLGDARTVFRFGVLTSLLSVAGFAAGLRWGILGVASGYAIANVLVFPYYTRIGAKAAGVRLRQFGAALAGITCAAVGMALAVYGLRTVLVGSVGPSLRLAIVIVAGAAIYGLLVLWWASDVAHEVRRAFRGRPTVLVGT